MKNKKLVIIVAAVAAAVVAGLFAYLWWEVLAQNINDSQGERVFREYFTDSLPSGFAVEDSAMSFKRNDSLGEFYGVAAVAVYTELSEDEISEKLKRAYGEISLVFCQPYDSELANIIGFSGIQKDLIMGNADGYYILYTVFEPKLNWESRNN